MAEFDKLTEAPVEFLKEGSRFVAKCTKPSKKEYLRLVRAVGIGFLMMGVVGYAIKLIHIPIRYLIVYQHTRTSSPRLWQPRPCVLSSGRTWASIGASASSPFLCRRRRDFFLMSFSSLLTQITGKGMHAPSSGAKQTPNLSVSASVPKSSGEARKTPTTAKKPSRSLLTTPAPDPAVQRLKEARRLEKEKQEELKRQKRLEMLKKRDSERDRLSRQKPVPSKDTAKKPPAAPARPPLPKMSFKELMSRAETVDKNKLVYAPIKMETKKKDAGKRPERKFAQPSPALLEKLSKREKPNAAKRDKQPLQRSARTDSYGIEADSGAEDEDSFIEDDSLDDFVVDDPRERRRDYNSDEIWQLFNRGKKRQYVDDDDDDMEATGADILEEEERALRQARLDDKREELLERRLKEEKLKRKKV
ncbi:hypothetical protein KL949_002972 [Ogataea haglerorum]|uniref:Uncharacterized protein n=1 Tax=Ogataea haglerorum TaxID=1937702 RepID=A0ABQ7RE22_9ASCO|nr:hypothetical protein KL913_002634 [Ogataea haglerorum]KAG7718000.1 hypothetical protein KL949_002972 [Ogataea haglerorum]KAG7763965.1 hypothetical protein KL946_003405 [Ogataea haglerorum]KAG7771575.1 hypothetical protein KL931_001273 [Ogataea haglerorum]